MCQRAALGQRAGGRAGGVGAIETSGRGGDPAIAVEFDRRLRHVDASPAALALVGLPAEAVIGRTAGEAGFPAEVAEPLEREMRAVLRSGEERQVELQVPTVEGPRWLHHRLVPARGPRGALRGVRVEATDITARKHAELRLAGENAAFRALVEDSPDLIARFDCELRHDYANRALGRAVGRPPAEFVGRTVHEVGLPRDIATRWEEALRSVFASGDGMMLDFRFPAPDGTRWFSARLVPERDADGRVGCVILACTDVTDRVNREAEQAALRRVATAVAREDDLAAIARVVAQETALLLAATGSAVYRLEGDLLVTCIAAHPPGEDGSVVPWTLELGGDTVTALVARSGLPARVDDYRAPGRRDPSVRRALESGLRSGIAAPLWTAGRLWGILVAGSDQPGAFGPADERRLDAFAELAAIAVGNAETRADLARLADTDPLTGLANRRAFTARLHGEFERARRHGHQLALAILDIDDFKGINDTHGHQTGDLVLAEVGRRLDATSRAGELVARIGGEEFAWILPETDAAGSVAAVERARREIAAIEVDRVRGITCSVGVCDIAVATSVDDLLRCADRALYRAKNAGRDRVEAAV